MTLVLGLMAAIWGLGWAFGAPRHLRLGGIVALWAVVILLHLALPAGHGLRSATGGNARIWLVLAGVAALILGYKTLIERLKSKAAAAPVVALPATAPLRPAELERYARHIMLREIGGMGQRQLKQAKVLVIGAGGLGAPALLYLAASGVGRIGVVDDDVVETSNLQRQIIHTDQHLGMGKVQSAQIAMQALNPFVEVQPHPCRLTEENAGELIAGYDLILDGSDNFDTRYLVNRAAVGLGKPLISGAITQWEGQLSMFDPARGGPCYECVFPDRPAPGMVPTCAEAGVVAALPGVIGAMMALEAIKHLTAAGETLRGRLLIHDALYAETRVIGVKPRDGCAVCGARPTKAPSAS